MTIAFFTVTIFLYLFFPKSISYIPLAVYGRVSGSTGLATSKNPGFFAALWGHKGLILVVLLAALIIAITLNYKTFVAETVDGLVCPSPVGSRNDTMNKTAQPLPSLHSETPLPTSGSSTPKVAVASSASRIFSAAGFSIVSATLIAILL